MRTISARFASNCTACGKRIAKDEEILYDDESRKAFHPACRPEPPAELFPDAGAEQLATKLGFRPHDEAVGEGGEMRGMSSPHRDGAAGNESEARGRQDADV